MDGNLGAAERGGAVTAADRWMVAGRKLARGFVLREVHARPFGLRGILPGSEARICADASSAASFHVVAAELNSVGRSTAHTDAKLVAHPALGYSGSLGGAMAKQRSFHDDDLLVRQQHLRSRPRGSLHP